MKTLDRNFFRRQQYTTQQLEAFASSAREDLLIATESDYTQVKFRFSYDALIKLGILLVARAGYKVRSIPGHHVKLLAAIMDLTGNEDVEAVATTMRQKRNLDLYEGGANVTDTEAAAYLKFVKDLYKSISL